MDYARVYEDGKDLVLTGVKHFIPAQTLDCGQCFRWRGKDGAFTGIAHGRRLEISFCQDVLILKDTTAREFETAWKEYFGFDRDYGAVRERFGKDAALVTAMDFAPGLRLMKQDPWEMLVTFILSQNSNIPRIKAMVERLCEGFGYDFPPPGILASYKEEDLAHVKCGYRVSYILDAARRVAGGEIDLNGLYTLDPEDACRALCKIKGVGPKVSDCVLLFGYGSLGRIPQDVWMKRVMAKYYAGGFPEELSGVAGIAQQFLFHYARSMKIKI